MIETIRRSFLDTIAAGANASTDILFPSNKSIKGIRVTGKCSANTASGNTTVDIYPLFKRKGVITAEATSLGTITIATTVVTEATPVKMPSGTNALQSIQGICGVRVTRAVAAGTGSVTLNSEIGIEVG